MIRLLRTLVVILLVALGFLGGYFAGWYLHGENVAGLSPTGATSAKEAGALQQRIIEELQERYYKPVDAAKLSEAGVRGTLKSLDDPYTVYLSPQEMRAFKETESGEYSGIGASLEKTKQGLLITNVFDGSPAAGAGLKPGNVIVTVDGHETAGPAIDVSIARIKGDEGTRVRLGVRRKGATQVDEVVVVRRRIEIPETRTRMVVAGGEKVGYIQLFEFGGNAARDVRRDVRELQSKGARAIILDLRYNGGGLLSQAVDVTGIFATGVVTSTQGLHSPLEVLKADGPVATRRPLVVLVNGYSASASEIVTGALQDHDRAEIVGTTTFGKGLVQSIVPLDGGSALKLTTAIYRTPDGTNINKKGITPDVTVRDDPKTEKDEQLTAALAYLGRRL